MKNVDIHIHPRSGHYVFGEKLPAGTVLEATDLYDSSSGRWEPCPCPGLVLQEGVATTWVRPSLAEDPGTGAATVGQVDS